MSSSDASSIAADSLAGIKQQKEDQVDGTQGALERNNYLKSQHLAKYQVSRLVDVLAVTTPIPDEYGNVSTKTPVFHLPMYKVDLLLRRQTKTIGPQKERDHQHGGDSDDDNCDADDSLSFHCDLADLTHLLNRLKELNQEWSRHGWEAGTY